MYLRPRREATLASSFQRQIKGEAMVVPNPKDALLATESLLRNVIEMLVDAEGQARDGGLHQIETQVQSLMQATNDVLAEVRGQLARR